MTQEGFVEKGFVHYNAGRYGQARDCFREALESKDRGNPEVRCFLAHSFQALGRSKEAVQELFKLVKASPRYLPGYLNLANILRLQGRLEEADSVLRKANKINPTEPEVRRTLSEVLRNRALQCKSQDRLDESRDCREARRVRLLKLNAKRASAIEAASPEAEKFRALASEGKYKKAFEVGERILNSGTTLQDLRVFWHPWNPDKLKDVFKEHIKILERMVKEKPETPWAGYYLAMLQDVKFEFDPLVLSSGKRYGWMQFKVAHKYLGWSQFQRALAQFKIALRYKPVDWRIHGFLAETYLCLRRRREAFRELERAKAVVPIEEATQVLAWKGAFHLWIGNYASALRVLDDACEQGALWAFCWRGGAKIKLGRCRSALEDLNKAIKLYPGDREAYVWRGEAKRELGLYPEALRDLNRKPVMMWALLNRALVKASLKDYEGMERDLGAIPEDKLNYFKRKIGLNLDRRLNLKEKKSLLEAGLRLGRGYRHNNQYGHAMWQI